MSRMGTSCRSDRGRDWTKSVFALVGILGIVWGLADRADAQTLSVLDTESLVRAVYFEGLPEEMGERVGADGAARLIEMLGDPAEARAHANILLALGMSGQPGSLEAIEAWASIPREGEIDRDTFRAWQALPFALGHAARHDSRAVRRLERQIDDDAPTWTFRQHRGARLLRQARRSAATALGMTGLPEAGDVLDRESQRTSDAEFDEHLRDARAMHRSRAAGRSRQ